MTRYASSLIILPDGSYQKMQVLELEKGKRVRMYPFTEELHSTVWIDGAIEITLDEEAFQLIPYDAVNRKSVDGTQRIRLK